MKKSNLIRVIAELMVNNDIFKEEVLEKLRVESQELSSMLMELVKARIMVRAEIENIHRILQAKRDILRLMEFIRSGR